MALLIVNILVYALILLILSNLVVSLKSLNARLTEILRKMDDKCDNAIDGRNSKSPLDFVRFEDSGCKVIYCPSLGIAGYGKTEDDAEESFRITLEETLKYIHERYNTEIKK